MPFKIKATRFAPKSYYFGCSEHTLSALNLKKLRALGIGLGLLLITLVLVRFTRSFEQGNTNWYSLTMLCGMALLLFYTLVKPRRKDKRRK